MIIGSSHERNLRSSQLKVGKPAVYCSANYLFCSCQEAQIKHNGKKQNYFAEQTKFAR